MTAVAAAGVEADWLAPGAAAKAVDSCRDHNDGDDDQLDHHDSETNGDDDQLDPHGQEHSGDDDQLKHYVNDQRQRE